MAKVAIKLIEITKINILSPLHCGITLFHAVPSSCVLQMSQINLWFFILHLMFVDTRRSVLTQSCNTAVVQVQIPVDIMGHREASEPAVRIDPSS